ncbi:DNA polymerase III subunit gamma/tau [Alkalithermobacter paradoxus]|uniref:DNA-directed DNA polymerase n=1 Tax=Alkalithermobacter paradoxus TaxID=29349 RepID=A0A1V4I4B4_9FIRM|nr:DNA polymerase III subunit tau [[Clostridium] thermoalcaliphilum]
MHKALYRVYRPLKFGDVVGQEHIIKTLKNQIDNNNIAHAYLFSGSRGTGKTSTAKIFARAVNCLEPHDMEPCNECKVCKGIISENIMDIIEIDAASNNGVDDIRELRENVKYPPSVGKYKVYIIDEVHMLSQGAFNALLKTLEEPPSYIIFILATTEPHKLPPTILSRCQRFDFKRVKLCDIVDRMKVICEDMGIKVEDRALNLIGKNSEGALRDALSILDQCISYTCDEVKYEDVVELLGTVNTEFLFNMTDYIIDQNTKMILNLVNDLVVWGKDIKHFLDELIDHFRNLMICKVSKEVDEILAFPDEIIQSLKSQSERISTNDIMRIINILSICENDMKYSSHQRVLLEIAIIKISQPMLDDNKDGILSRLEKLEKQIASGVKLESTSSKSNSTEKISKEDKKVSIKIQSSDKIKKIWPEILDYMKKDKNIPTAAMLKEAEEFVLEGKTLVIVFDDIYKFHKEALSKESTKEYIKKVVSSVTNQDLGIKLSLKSELMITDTSNHKDEGLEILESIFPKEIIQIKHSDKDI